MKTFNFLIFSVAAVLLSSCSREVVPTSSDKVMVRIQAPQRSQMFANALQALPTDRKLCFAINIRGTGITESSSECDPRRGLMAGFVESGQELSLEVSTGQRDIELYLYMPGDAACPAMPGSFKELNLAQLFSVGLASGVNLSGAESRVTIGAQFPGFTEHLARKLDFPSRCIAQVRGPDQPPQSNPNFATTAGGGVTQGQLFRVRAQLGAPAVSQVSTGQEIKLQKQ